MEKTVIKKTTKELSTALKEKVISPEVLEILAGLLEERMTEIEKKQEQEGKLIESWIPWNFKKKKLKKLHNEITDLMNSLKFNIDHI